MTLYVYLAAPYAARDSLQVLADELSQIGMTVTSSWLEETHEVNADTVGTAPGIEDAQAASHVRADFGDIRRSDVLVIFTPPTWITTDGPLHLPGDLGNSGGRHVETGYALALDKAVLVVGQAENIFHRTLPVVRTWHEAVLWLVAHERACPQAVQS